MSTPVDRVFRECELTFTFAMLSPVCLSVCRLSVTFARTAKVRWRTVHTTVASATAKLYVPALLLKVHICVTRLN